MKEGALQAAAAWAGSSSLERAWTGLCLQSHKATPQAATSTHKPAPRTDTRPTCSLGPCCCRDAQPHTRAQPQGPRGNCGTSFPHLESQAHAQVTPQLVHHATALGAQCLRGSAAATSGHTISTVFTAHTHSSFLKLISATVSERLAQRAAHPLPGHATVRPSLSVAQHAPPRVAAPLSRHRTTDFHVSPATGPHSQSTHGAVLAPPSFFPLRHHS